MILSERLFVLLFLLCCVVLCEAKKDRKGRHFLALLGYLHGYKIGQEYALHFPQYLITPVVVVPSVNQQQSVNIQQASSDENYQENGGILQAISPAKIILPVNATTSKEDDVMNTEKENDDIELPPPQKPYRGNNLKGIENSTDSLRESIQSSINITTVENITTINQMLAMSHSSNFTIRNETALPIKGQYPSANYDNKIINNLTLTTTVPSVENSQSLPPILDNRWQNFTLRANFSAVLLDGNNNMTMINEHQNNTVPQNFSPENETSQIPERGSKGPYPSAWYNNKAIDQLSITTNHYTNESPSQAHDGWGSYSPMNILSSGFKPLAGLYYDGYLHTPLKKYDFSPEYYWN